MAPNAALPPLLNAVDMKTPFVQPTTAAWQVSSEFRATEKNLSNQRLGGFVGCRKRDNGGGFVGEASGLRQSSGNAAKNGDLPARQGLLNVCDHPAGSPRARRCGRSGSSLIRQGSTMTVADVRFEELHHFGR
jgi:hypothetical protein